MTRFYLVQSDVAWEQPDSNRQHFSELMSTCVDGVIVLPEMFTTGFSMASSRLAEPMTGVTLDWMKTQAATLRSVICGSQIIGDAGQYFNRFLWVEPDGQVIHYDKRHLFRMADEHHHYAPGQHRVTLAVGDMQLLPQVCYDLRFPAFSRNRSDYDLLLYVANWPSSRRDQWLALLKARAIENQAYVIAVNRIGLDGNGVDYAGDSCVIDFRGKVLLDLAASDAVADVDLELAPLQEYRQAFPAHLDADEFELQM